MNFRDYYERDTQLQIMLSNLPEQFFEQVYIKTYKADETIIHQGKPPHIVGIILEGVCSVLTDMECGHSTVLCKLVKYDIFGAYEFVNNMRHNVSNIVTHTDCIILLIPKNVIEDLMENNPRLLLVLYTNITFQMKQNINFLTECKNKSTTYCMITYLINTYELYRKHHSGVIKIDDSREYIADCIGASVRSINRAIESLKYDSMITIEKGKILITSQQFELLKSKKLELLL